MLQRNPSIEFRDITRHPKHTMYVGYNKRPICLLGSVRGFLFPPMGLDLHEKLGVVITQIRAEPFNLLEDTSQDQISENWSSYFAQLYAHVFNRLGRSKHHTAYTNFKFVLVPRQFKDRKIANISRIEMRKKSKH